MKQTLWLFLFFILFGFSQAQSLTCEKAFLSQLQKGPLGLKLNISAGPEVEPQLIDQFQTYLQSALAEYENHFPKVQETLEIRIGSSSKSLRTGYDFKENILNFPAIEGVNSFGLESADVIHHETFHFLTCRNFPYLCVPQLLKSKEALVLHEALADYFSYHLNPDQNFGDGYFSDGRSMRKYKNDLLFSLAEGPHAQGNALTKYLIQNNISLSEIATFLSHQNFLIEDLINLNPQLKKQVLKDIQIRIEENVQNYPASSIKKYRISNSTPLLLQFTPNQDLLTYAPNLEIIWVTESGQKSDSFNIQQKTTPAPNLEFEVSPLTNARSEKMIALITSNGKILGSRTYYFGPAF